jgi:hypothetical protein
MKKIAICTTLCLGLGLAQSVLASDWLVTEDEMNASLAAPEPMRTRAVPVPGAPRIDLQAPVINAPVKAPVNIRLAFNTESPAQARPDSFKAYYGRLRIDITQRLLGAAKVTADGIQVDGAALPKGQHRLSLRIEDSMGRTGERTFEFEVQ